MIGNRNICQSKGFRRKRLRKNKICKLKIKIKILEILLNRDT